MLGASTAAFSLPFALGYAWHAGRGASGSRLGKVALAVAALETLACLIAGGARIIASFS